MFQLRLLARISVFVAIFLAAPSLAEDSEDMGVFTYEALSCFGNCPTYEVYLFEDGLLIFSGGFNTAHDGVHRQQVAPELFTQILEEFDALAPLEAEMDCEGYNTDHKGVRLLLRTSSGLREIDYNYGCSAPKEEFLQQLDKITDLLPIQELAKSAGKKLFDN